MLKKLISVLRMMMKKKMMMKKMKKVMLLRLGLVASEKPRKLKVSDMLTISLF